MPPLGSLVRALLVAACAALVIPVALAAPGAFVDPVPVVDGAAEAPPRLASAPDAVAHVRLVPRHVAVPLALLAGWASLVVTGLLRRARHRDELPVAFDARTERWWALLVGAPPAPTVAR